METLKHCLDKQVEAIADVERLITEAREMTDSPSGIKSRLAGLRVQRLNIDSKIERLLEDFKLKQSIEGNRNLFAMKKSQRFESMKNSNQR